MRNQIITLFIFINCFTCVSCSQNSYMQDYTLTSIAASPSGDVMGCGDRGRIAFTKDLKHWNYESIDPEISSHDIEYFKDNFVVLGNNASSGNSVLCFYNPDNGKWDITKYEGYIDQIEIANSRLFSFSQDSIKVTDNGTSWEDVPFPLRSAEREEISNSPDCMLYDGKNYIVTGSGNFVATSPDLIKWDFKVENSMGTGSSLGIASNGKNNVIVGDKLFIASSDINNNQWTVRYSGEKIKDIETVSDYYTLCLFDVTSDGKKFVAVGARSLVLNSDDGVNWTIAKTDERPWLRKILWNGKLFIVLADGGLITSPDGETWSKLK